MLREMDFVENDWAALFWALGSATALFKHLEAPMSNLSDVLSRTQALMKKIRRRTLIGYAVCLIMIATCARFFFVFHNTLQRVGSGLTLAATLYIAYQLYERGIRTLPPEIRPAASTDFYRAELARERDFQCGIRFWFRLVIPSAGVILILIGSAMADPGSTRELAFIVACFIGLCIVEVPINRRLSRKYQRQMDELDALPKES